VIGISYCLGPSPYCDNCWRSRANWAFLLLVNFQLGSNRTVIVAILALAILAVLVVIGREIYRATHPRSKPMRKRKRREF
jgi:hypothetical protein